MSEYLALGLLVNDEHLDQSLLPVEVNVAVDLPETAEEAIAEAH